MTSTRDENQYLLKDKFNNEFYYMVAKHIGINNENNNTLTENELQVKPLNIENKKRSKPKAVVKPKELLECFSFLKAISNTMFTREMKKNPEKTM
eukprot:Pgem_evm1s5155